MPTAAELKATRAAAGAGGGAKKDFVTENAISGASREAAAAGWLKLLAT